MKSGINRAGSGKSVGGGEMVIRVPRGMESFLTLPTPG